MDNNINDENILEKIKQLVNWSPGRRSTHWGRCAEAERALTSY